MHDRFLFGRKITAVLRWFTVGLGIKRWLLLLALGILVAGLGIYELIVLLNQAALLPASLVALLTLQFLPLWLRILLPLLLGIGLMAVAVAALGKKILAPFPLPEEGLVASLYAHNRQSQGPHIVAIGGGTGMPTLIRGLRTYTRNITAIVTVADDGGSSGRLRRELGLLPPGDFRNNLAALSRDEALMTKLLQYRFGGMRGVNGRSELQGHAFGNLLLAALAGITGSFDEALLAAEKVLAMRGRVLPSTLSEVTLYADVVLAGGGETAVTERVVGESAIPKAGKPIQQVGLLPASVRAYPPALKAIFQADMIVMGPGSLYTSILPNLLIPDLASALQHSRAKKVYVCNLATQPGETDNYTVAEHINTLIKHTSPDCIDIVLANDNLTIPSDTGGGNTIFVQPVATEHVDLITADLVDEQRPWRHDSDKLAAAIMNMLAL